MLSITPPNVGPPRNHCTNATLAEKNSGTKRAKCEQSPLKLALIQLLLMSYVLSPMATATDCCLSERVTRLSAVEKS